MSKTDIIKQQCKDLGIECVDVKSSADIEQSDLSGVPCEPVFMDDSGEWESIDPGYYWEELGECEKVLA